MSIKAMKIDGKKVAGKDCKRALLLLSWEPGFRDRVRWAADLVVVERDEKGLRGIFCAEGKAFIAMQMVYTPLARDSRERDAVCLPVLHIWIHPLDPPLLFLPSPSLVWRSHTRNSRIHRSNEGEWRRNGRAMIYICSRKISFHNFLTIFKRCIFFSSTFFHRISLGKFLPE